MAKKLSNRNLEKLNKNTVITEKHELDIEGETYEYIVYQSLRNSEKSNMQRDYVEYIKEIYLDEVDANDDDDDVFTSTNEDGTITLDEDWLGGYIRETDRNTRDTLFVLGLELKYFTDILSEDATIEETVGIILNLIDLEILEPITNNLPLEYVEKTVREMSENVINFANDSRESIEKMSEEVDKIVQEDKKKSDENKSDLHLVDAQTDEKDAEEDSKEENAKEAEDKKDTKKDKKEYTDKDKKVKE